MGSGRLWVGPLLLILIIALIYIFSLIPHTHVRGEFDSPPGLHSFLQDERRIIETLNDADLSPECNLRGSLNGTDGYCTCIPLYSGEKCELPVCLNDGTLDIPTRSCECGSRFTGNHCEIQCSGGVPNRTTGRCDCFRRFFGRACDLVCINGNLDNGECKCIEGYTGLSCTICDQSYHGEATLNCGIPERKKGAVNSRLTLSGLSFCMITIGLLCVTARRRRLTATGLPPSNDDTWYRVFQPQSARARCRHDFMCGGSWIPRDRTLLVGPVRTTARVSRNTAQRTVTPPPSYVSVENVNSSEAPPTYEEAVHRVEESERDRLTETDKEEEAEHAEEVIVVENREL